jgi:protein tyrosine phosphatase (PTP) superfamily phosphohydrolase (DUF442 family)
MKNTLLPVLFCTLSFFGLNPRGNAGPSETHGDATASAMPALEGIENGQWASNLVAVGGQPSPTSFEGLHAADVRMVINFRTAQEMTFDEKAAVEAAGMRYVHMPIGGLDDFFVAAALDIPVPGMEGATMDPLGRLHAVLNTNEMLSNMVPGASPTRTLVHCASGNRVGAAFALMAQRYDGASVEDALVVGRNHGLTGLESKVAEALKAAAKKGSD